MIFRGLAGGSSNKARKTLTRHAKNPPMQVTLVMQCCDEPQEEHYPIVFTEEEARPVHHPHNDSLVVTILIANKRMGRILVDGGSSADIMTLEAFDKMGLNMGDMRCVDTWLSSFAGGTVLPMEMIVLPVTLGEGDQQSTKMVDLLVVDIPSVYNMILGRLSLYKFKAIILVYHHIMKFPSAGGVGAIKGEQQSARSCYEVACRTKRNRSETVMMTEATR